MRPTKFQCNRCKTPLPVGAAQCPHCGGQAAPVLDSAAPASPGIAEIAPKIVLAVMVAGIVILYPQYVKARNGAHEVASMSNLKLINISCQIYETDHHGQLPPLDSLSSFKKAMTPYITSNGRYKFQDDLFVQTGSGAPYALNKALSNKSVKSISNPQNTVVLQETIPHADQRVWTAYADGSVRLTPIVK